MKYRLLGVFLIVCVPLQVEAGSMTLDPIQRPSLESTVSWIEGIVQEYSGVMRKGSRQHPYSGPHALYRIELEPDGSFTLFERSYTGKADDGTPVFEVVELSGRFTDSTVVREFSRHDRGNYTPLTRDAIVISIGKVPVINLRSGRFQGRDIWAGTPELKVRDSRSQRAVFIVVSLKHVDIADDLVAALRHYLSLTTERWWDRSIP